MSEPKNIDVLLILAPPFQIPEVPPLGLWSLKESLDAAGMRARVLDLNEAAYRQADENRRRYWDKKFTPDLMDAENADEAFEALYPLVEPLLATHFARSPLIVGFSHYHLNTRFSVRLAELFRARCPETAIVWGGPSNLETSERRKVPRDLVDYAFVGESETRLVRLASALAQKKKPDDIPGLLDAEAFHEDFDPTALMFFEDIARLPFPRYAGYAPSQGKDRPFLPVLLARGCPRNCSFCNGHVIRYRARPVEDVMREIEHHVMIKNIRRFFFCDQLLDADPRSLETLCDALIISGLRVEWWGQVGIRTGLAPGLFEKMRRSGCLFLSWGVESFSDEILSRMKKHSSAELAIETIAAAHRARIRQLIYLIVGFPGETEETFAETLKRLENVRPFVESVSLMPCQTPPLSPLFEEPTRFGIDAVTVFSRDEWRSMDGKNTPEKRNEWLVRLAERAFDLDFDVQCPIHQPEHFSFMLGRIARRTARAEALAAGRIGESFDWFFHRGRFLVYRGEWPVLTDLGFFIDWDVSDKRANAHEIRWKKEGNRLRSENIRGVEWEIEAESAGPELRIGLYARASKETMLERFKANLVFPKKFKRWEIGDRSGHFESSEKGPEWEVVGPIDERGRLPLDDDYGFRTESAWKISGAPYHPTLELAGEANALSPFAQIRCTGGNAVGFYLKRAPVPETDFRLFARFRLRVFNS